MRSLDTETTGVDFWHGARPFFVTSCDDRGIVEYWEWDVDPLTRKVQIPAGDWQEVMDILKVAAGWGKLTTDPASLEQHKLVLQNSKFDVTALNSVTEVREPDLIERTYGPGSTSKITVPPGRINLKTGKRTVAGTNREVTTKITPGQWKCLDGKSVNEIWPWAMTDDTLSAGHVLASGMPHDLTSMAIEYLGINIEPYEVALNKLTEECRRACRSRYPDWQIAAKGRPDMPSAKEKCWKFDGWLPRALARQENLPEPDPACKHQWDDDHLCTGCGGHHYWKVLAEYANTDSSVTALLWPVIAEELRRRGLWEIYVEAMRLPPILVQMESKGVTLSKKRLRDLRVDYSEESERLGRVMVSIAKGYGYDLQLPRSGNNESLLAFCFGKSMELQQTTAKGKVKVKRDRSVRLTDHLCLNLPRVAYTESGAPSLDSKRAIPEYLIRLPENSKQRMFIEKLAAKRARDTALTYMISYERFWLPVTPATTDAAAGFTARIVDTDWYVLHPSLNPTGTITLRLSSSNPNEQNISKREGFNLRHCFGPAPGREWWCMDAKNIEARLPAWESGEQELIDLYNRPDEPPYYGSMHLLNFHTVYPDLWEKELGRVCGDPRCCGDVVVDITRIGPHCKKKFAGSWYQHCKNGGFAIQYGCQEPKADNTFKRKGAFKLLKARFVKLEKLNQYWINFAEKHGYVETIPDRTVNPNRGYPMMLQRGAYGKIKPTEPLNYHIQGTACQWARKAMIRSQAQLDRWRAEDGFDGHMIMQVHDELDFDFPRAADPVKDPKNSNLGRAQVLAGLMRQGGEDIGIPTPVNLEYCPDTWANSITIT